MRSKIILVIILALPVCYIWSCNRNRKAGRSPDFKFPRSLNELGFFKGTLNELIPAGDVIRYELSSTLFSDYAEKQRLIKLPKGKKMILKGNGLPVFPEGTMIAKTFYYGLPDTEQGRQIIETRVLFLKKGFWFAGTYKWNKMQNKADYTPLGSTVPVLYKGTSGRNLKISYHIPSAEECRSCHRSDDEIIPIGPKAMNMNRLVKVNGQEINQLKFFKQQGILTDQAAHVETLPDYRNAKYNLEQRARAYLEINCAHCHNPTGMAYQQSILLGYHIPLEQSGILLKKNNIAERMGMMGPFHMPQIGTTVMDKNGVELVRKYLNSLAK